MAAVRQASTPSEIASVRSLFAEYVRGVDEPCCFIGFDRELAELPRGYRRLLLAEEDGVAAGCVALRELDRRTAEVKRLYVRPAFRGAGLGVRLLNEAIQAARSDGFDRVVLDSLPKMREALALYAALGFREVPPYLAEPTPGARCFELRL